LCTTFPWLGRKLVFAIFQIPKKKKSNASRIEFIAKTNTIYYEQNGKKRALFHWPGTGKKVLLLHGWGSDSGRWKLFAPLLLEQGYDVYAVDAPGHGKSSGIFFNPKAYAESIKPIVEKYKINYLIGHSAGAYTTIYYCSTFVHKLEKIVALAPTYDLNDVINGMKKMLSLNENSIQLLKLEFQHVYGAPIERYRADELAKNIKTEALLIHDEDDKILPITGSDALAASWKNVKYIRTQKLGHGLNNSKIYHSILEFIK